MTPYPGCPAPTWNLKWIDENLITSYRPPEPLVDFKQAKSLVFSRWANGDEDAGVLRIDRAATAEGHWRFQVSQELRTQGRKSKESQEVKADFLCASGDFPQLISWSLSSVDKQDSKKLTYTQNEEKGRIEAGQIVYGDDKPVSLSKVSRPLTANWALFYYVPAWAAGAGEVPTFDTLEELQFYRPEHTLVAAGEEDFRFGGGKVWRLRAFKQMGRGILPIVYWLDEAGRPLLVSTAVGFTYYLKTLA